MAMEKLPIIGSVVRVVTFGRYDFDDERHHANVEIPNVELQGNEGDSQKIGQLEESVNQAVEMDIDQIVQDFKDSLEEDYVKSIDISYETLTDTDSWFTLKLNITEIQASGYMYSKFYNIDKKTGAHVQLGDLFKDGADYVTVISENIKEQMRQRMEKDESQMFFIGSAEDGFEQIKEDQNFYLNTDGELVIAFDEYEVAPGYMGTSEFVISEDVIGDIRK